MSTTLPTATLAKPKFSWRWKNYLNSQYLEFDVLGNASDSQARSFYQQFYSEMSGDQFFMLGNYGDRETNLTLDSMLTMIEQSKKIGIVKHRFYMVTTQQYYGSKIKLFDAACRKMEFDGKMMSSPDIEAGRAWIKQEIRLSQ